MISISQLQRARFWCGRTGPGVLTISAICVGIALWRLYAPAWTELLSHQKVHEPTALTAGQAPSYSGLPIAFEPNTGQAEARVKFVSHSGRATLALAPSGAVLTFNSPKSSHLARQLHMKIVGANPNADAIGLGKLPGKVNYFLGNNPQHWRTNVPTYSGVKVRAVYPGIDLVYRDNGHGHLEYDFFLSSRADIRKIRLAFPETSAIKLDSGGTLALHIGPDELRLAPAAFYQEVDGATVSVPGRFVLHSDRTVGFAAGPYDRTRPLVIDPVLAYSTFLGGIGADRATAVAVDSAGNAYITGSTTSPDFPGPRSALGHSSTVAEEPDAFVAKINASGSSLLYLTYLGGSKSDGSLGIAIDSQGKAYIAGYTGSPDFPTVAPIQSKHGGGYDVFVSKLSADGSRLVYSTFLGGSGGEGAAGIAVDGSGNAYVTGFTGSPDFPTAHPLQASLHGPFDVFVSKLSPDGRRLIYSTFVGGSNSDEGVAIAIDSQGSAYVTGSVTSPDFPTVNPVQAKYAGGFVDAFVLKLNPAGSALVYSTYLGGSFRDQGAGIAVDRSGNAYVAGFTGSADFPVAHSFQPKLGGGFDAFVAKLDPTGSQLLFSTYLGGSGNEEGAAIAVDHLGNAFVTGFTGSTNFPVVGALQQKLGGATDAFLTQLNPAGVVQFSTFLGGTGEDQGTGVSLDRSGNVYLTGYTASADFPVVHPLQREFAGKEDAFLAKIATKLPRTRERK